MFKKTTLRAEIQDKHVLHRYSTTCVITLNVSHIHVFFNAQCPNFRCEHVRLVANLLYSQ